MALATLAGGAGLAFYAWLWIMVPTADESARRNARRPASPIAPAVSLAPHPAFSAVRRPQCRPRGRAMVGKSRRRCFRPARFAPVGPRRRSGGAGPAAGYGRPAARRPAALVPGPQHAVRQGNPAGRRPAPGGGHHDCPAAGRGRAPGDPHPRRRRAGRCSHRLDAARRNPPRRAAWTKPRPIRPAAGRAWPPDWRWWSPACW